MSGDRPLQGLRVIDLADEKGELCGRLLADLGADVIRVEPPEGARSRRIPPFHGETSLYFAYRNFNKRGIRLDFESATDRGDGQYRTSGHGSPPRLALQPSLLAAEA